MRNVKKMGNRQNKEILPKQENTIEDKLEGRIVTRTYKIENESYVHTGEYLITESYQNQFIKHYFNNRIRIDYKNHVYC